MIPEVAETNHAPDEQSTAECPEAIAAETAEREAMLAYLAERDAARPIECPETIAAETAEREAAKRIDLATRAVADAVVAAANCVKRQVCGPLCMREGVEVLCRLTKLQAELRRLHKMLDQSENSQHIPF